MQKARTCGTATGWHRHGDSATSPWTLAASGEAGTHPDCSAWKANDKPNTCWRVRMPETCRRELRKDHRWEKTEHLIDQRTTCQLWVLQGCCTALHEITWQSQRLYLHQTGFQHTHKHITLQFPNNSLQTVCPERPDGVFSCRMHRGLQIPAGSQGLTLAELDCMLADNCLSSLNACARGSFFDQMPKEPLLGNFTLKNRGEDDHGCYLHCTPAACTSRATDIEM